MEAQAFGQHLADCEKCQVELTRLLQLDQLGRGYIERHGPVDIPWHALPRNRWMAGGFALASMVAVAFILLGTLRPQAPRALPELWAQPQRTLEARVTYLAADRYRRPPQVMMGGAAARSGPNRSLALLSELEKRGDLHQLAVAYLATGVPEPSSAKAILEGMRGDLRWQSADVLCDLGVAHYVASKPLDAARATEELREALRLFDTVLAMQPGHVQALWNRSLVYRDLGLPLSAMKDLTEFEHRETDEGWRSEARDRRARLSSTLRRKERWLAADQTGADLINRGAQELARALTFVDVPLLRRDFYHAVRARTSSTDVLALLPLAERLDASVGSGTVLADYVHQVAARDFSRRAPLAEQYARLISGRIPESEQDVLLQRFLTSDETDLALGALAHVMQRLPAYASELVRRTQHDEDPWFRVLGLQAQAMLERQQEHYKEALAPLEQALDICRRERLVYRCIFIENDLSHVKSWLFRVNAAAQHARDGLALARPNQWDLEGVMLQALGNVARQAADVTLGRAYYGEALLMAEGDKWSTRNIHQNLAHLAIWALELDEARASLDRAMDTGLPLTQHGVAALVDVARTRRSPRDALMVEQALAREPGNTPGQRAYAKFLHGRFLVEVDPARGRMLLDEAIRQAEALPLDGVSAAHARAYSYTSLIFADADTGDFIAALARFGAELGFETPARCVLGLTADTERSLLVARGAQGQLLSAYVPLRSSRFEAASMEGAVPPEMLAALQSCTLVDVLARPPLQGRSGLLPPGIAWRYRTRAAAPPPPAGPGTHLVVNEVRYSEERNEVPLQWLPRTAPGAEARFLRDLAATPTQVLEAISTATEIDLATHGKVDPDSNFAYLLLAPGADGRDTLFEDSIRASQLTGAPLVVLAACEGGRPNAALHRAGSLPSAFLAAGARAVLAATHPIPDLDSSAFFGAVRDRVLAGASLAVAVRDERLQWLSAGGDSEWVNAVLVFE
ncbi:CHAT domain-containing protein [Myxococcus sp. MxC21-1]|uniref:CHAT domain-containing protein n=1 Tax=Myxococcus sp. MxC21-1 TaxID=3041439 RepID=UPI002930E08D|nr:CHAT domain-containing protein [Myxococcus sp. MxC21-1]WNZ62083.1 CHAT domain-containing protein [Myxococcus sp. MxC21-1]